MSANVHVFISYAHKDGSTLASRLRRDLAEKGYVVWLDVARLGGGSDWSREIEKEIDEADVVLALLSTGSFESDVCRGEQLRSLRRHKCVIPILVHDNADRPVYLEARQYRNFAVSALHNQRLEELIQDIETRSSATLASKYQETRYDTVPDLPENFVPRPAELEALKQTILSDRDQRHVALVALKGMGGIGKTVLAQALCHDESVQAAFPDGIIWVKIGEKPSDADLINQMRETAKALDKSTDGFDTLIGSSNLLRNLLKGKNVLLVLDDVWNAKHVSYFQTHGARFCRLLLTTRDADIGKATGAQSHPLDVLTRELSRRLLANYAGLSEDELPGEANGIIQECDGLPLALAMIGAMLRDEPNSRWADVLDSLKNANLEEIQIQFPDYAFPSLVAAIEVSVKQLPEETRKFYLDLAVFPEDTPIPECALAVLWNREAKDVRRIAAQFANRSLATRAASGCLGLHDLQVDYVRNKGIRKQAGVESLSALHARFLEAYAVLCKDGWSSGPPDGYYFEHLPWHLKEGGRATELRQLLLNFDWLQAKLEATNVETLIGDYDLLPDDPVCRIVQEAVQMSASILSVDRTQLSSQLLGRLLSADIPDIQHLLELSQISRPPRLVPLTSSLTAPRSAGSRGISGHQSSVDCLTVADHGRLVVFGSKDATLKVWDSQSGSLLRTINDDSNDADRALERGRRVLLAGFEGRRELVSSSSGALNVWDLESGALICGLDEDKVRHTYPNGYVAPVAALTVTPGGRRVIWASGPALRIWDLETDEFLSWETDHPRSITQLALSEDGQVVISGSSEFEAMGSQDVLTLNALRVWNVLTGQCVRSLVGHPCGINGLAITSDGGYVVSAPNPGLYAFEDTSLRVWAVNTGEMVRAFSGHRFTVTAVAVTPNQRLLISGGGSCFQRYSPDFTVRLWNFATGDLIRSFDTHTGPVISLLVTPDNRWAVSAGGSCTSSVPNPVRQPNDARYSNDGSIRVWDLEREELAATFQGEDAVTCLLMANPETFIARSRNGAIHVLSFNKRSGLNSASTGNGERRGGACE